MVSPPENARPRMRNVSGIMGYMPLPRRVHCLPSSRAEPDNLGAAEHPFAVDRILGSESGAAETLDRASARDSKT